MTIKRFISILLSFLPVVAASAQDVGAAIFAEVSSLAASADGRVFAGLLMGENRETATACIAAVPSAGGRWEQLESPGISSPAVSCVVWISPDGRLRCFVSAVEGGRPVVYQVVKDDSWSSASKLAEGICSAAPAVLPDGSWLLALSSGEKSAVVLRSADAGSSWSELSSLEVPSKTALDMQPALDIDPENRLSILMRSVGYGWSYKSVSCDGGRTWSTPQCNIPVPDQRFAEIRLLDGKLLSVKNGRLDQHLYRLPDALYAFLSDDGGETWYGSLRLEEGVEAYGPVAAALPGGSILIAYNYAKAGVREIRTVRTSAAEIDRATANLSFSAVPADKTTVLVPGKAAQDFRSKYAPKKKYARKSFVLATYNIRYMGDDWSSVRLPALKELFGKYCFDIFGCQEPYLNQVHDILSVLGDDWDWVGGVPGQPQRETLLNPIFYRKSRFEVLHWDNLWFTEVPDTPGFGAFSPRMCVWARLRDKQSGVEFYLFNSHFDHRGHEARKVSALLLLDKIREVADGLPVFLTGDFNDFKEAWSCRQIAGCGFLADTMVSVEDPVNAEFNSEPGFRAPSTFPRNGNHLDHIYYTPSCIKLLSWELVTWCPNGKMGSDHLPIMIECKLAVK